MTTQDMVVEFAKMNKHQLLDETEKAVSTNLSNNTNYHLKIVPTLSLSPLPPSLPPSLTLCLPSLSPSSLSPEIGPKEMYESHEKLKGMKSRSADLKKTLREKRKELGDEQRKNQLLERDVERFKNRQKYMSRIGHIKKKKMWVVS